MSSQYQQVPNTPRVISPSPTPSEQSGKDKDDYFAPTTRSKAQRLSSVEDVEETTTDNELDPELMRARSRSRSPQVEQRPTRMTANGGITTSAKAGMPSTAAGGSAPKENGFLSPASAYPTGFGSAYWRNLSRSPSPLGLIPIHREWRAFIHKHEIPRKVLHVSIGFVTLWFYWKGAQQVQIHPLLMGLFIPIFTVDLIRFKWPEFNRFYIRCLGAFMRESEAHDRFNGVISYIGGLWAVMYFCRKDVAVVSILLLSWCDTAASTFGRLWGKYTPRIRKGKSLAGSIAAFVFGVAAAVLFWGVIAPVTPKEYNSGVNSLAFHGQLALPALAREYLGLTVKQATISGESALGVMAVISGLVASVSEALDIFSLDDNLTIPVLCGAGLGAFLWTFGGS